MANTKKSAGLTASSQLDSLRAQIAKIAIPEQPTTIEACALYAIGHRLEKLAAELMKATKPVVLCGVAPGADNAVSTPEGAVVLVVAPTTASVLDTDAVKAYAVEHGANLDDFRVPQVRGAQVRVS